MLKNAVTSIRSDKIYSPSYAAQVHSTETHYKFQRNSASLTKSVDIFIGT